MSRDDDSVVVTEAPGTVTEAPATEPVTTEANQTEQSAGTPESPETPAETKPEGPTEAEQAAAFENFKNTVELAVAELDQTTGIIPDGPVATVKAAYVALPLAKNKKAARDHLDSQMKSSLTTPPFDPYKAKAYLDLNEAVKATGSTRETVARPPVDPTEEFVKLVSAHWIATSMLIAGPEVAADYVQQATQLSQSLTGEAKTYKDYLIQHAAWAAKPEAERGDEPQAPEVNEVVLHAAKIAQGRRGGVKAPKANTGSATASATPSYTGPRRDVKKHIVEAMATKAVGETMKIGEIARFKSSVYPEGDASGGAVSSAMKGAKFADYAPHIKLVTEGGVQVARKVA